MKFYRPFTTFLLALLPMVVLAFPTATSNLLPPHLRDNGGHNVLRSTPPQSWAALLDRFVPRDLTSSSVNYHQAVHRSTTGVSVAIYRPLDPRDPSHWAIYLKGAATEKQEVILQVFDDHGAKGYYVADPAYGKQPSAAGLFETEIDVGSFDTTAFEEVEKIIQETPVDNKSHTWNCQAWVMEALDRVQQQHLFTWDAKGKAAVTARRQNWQ